MSPNRPCFHTYRSRPVVLLLLVLLFAAVRMSDGLRLFDYFERQDEDVEGTPSPTPSPSPLDYKIGRLFHVSSEGPMTKIMRGDEKFVKATKYLLDYVDYVQSSAVHFLKNEKRPSEGQTFMPCNHDGAGFVKSFVSNLDLRGLPFPDTSCLTQFEGAQTFPDEPSRFTATELDMALRNRTAQVYEERFVISNVILGNWSESDVGRMYAYNTTSKRCIVNHASGTRANGHWYLATAVTNKPLAQNLPLYGRQYLTEFMRVDDNGTLADPLILSINERPPDGDDTPHKRRNDTTTALASNRGSVGPHAYGKMYPEQIPAYSAAIDMSDLSIQQADDALTPSSLAILLMPLALNLVPLALLAQVNTFCMLVYTLMSDVVTVVPLAIKGVELIIIGKERHVAAAIRFSTPANGSLPEDGTGAMEMWTAECRARDNVLPTGIAFVVLAIAFIILGIALEFIAKSYVRRRKLRRKLLEVEHEPLVSYDESALPKPQGGDDAIGAIGATRGVSGAAGIASGSPTDAWDIVDDADYSAPNSH